MDSPHQGTARQFEIVKENWLTRKPHADAAIVMAIVTFAVILSSLLYWADFHGAAAWMTASKATVFEQHQYWRAWTTLLVHGDGKHLFSNMLLFYGIGVFLAGYFGLWWVPFSGFLTGGALNFIVLSGMAPTTELIGASGIVFWMGGAWLVLYFLVETRRSLLQRGLRALGVALMLFMPAEAFDPSISYKSHLWGFVFGVLWGIGYYLMKKRPLREAEITETVFEEADGDSILEGNSEPAEQASSEHTETMNAVQVWR